MDSEAPGESTSSPSGNPTVTTIKGGAGERAEVLLSDGSSFFVSPVDPGEIGLREGQEVPEGLHGELARRQELHLGREKAVELLARREHSSAELRRKLLQRGFSAEPIERVLAEMRQKGYLDDTRFARIYTEARLRRKAMGQYKLLEELIRKGVERPLAEQTVAEYCTDEYQRRAVEEAAAKALKRTGEDREKLLRALKNRGFGMTYIRECRVLQRLDRKK